MNNTKNLLLKHCVEQLSKTNKSEVSFGYLVNQVQPPYSIDQQSEVLISDHCLLASVVDVISQKVKDNFLRRECSVEEFFYEGINLDLGLPSLAHEKIKNVRYLPIAEEGFLYAIVILINISVTRKRKKDIIIDVKPYISSVITLLKNSQKRTDTFAVSESRKVNDKLIEVLLNNTFHPALLFSDELKIVKANSASQQLFNANTQRGWASLDKLLEQTIPETALEIFSTINKYSFLGHLDCTQWTNIDFLITNCQSIKVDIHLFEYNQEKQQYFGLMLNKKTQENGVDSEEYHSSIQRFKVLTNVIPTAILQVDKNWQCSYVNETWTRYTNLTLEQSKDNKWLTCLSYYNIEELLPEIYQSTSQNNHFKKEIQLTIGSNTIWVELHVAGLFSYRYELTGMILTMHDITVSKVNSEKLTKLANYDHLTGLSNRSFFNDRLSVAMSRVRRHGLMAILFIDLDKFKSINDTYGHAIGDEVLKEISRRLNVTVRHEDSIARLGGDEFAIILTDLSSHEFLVPIARKIVNSINAPINLNQKELVTSCSIGIATSDDDVATPTDILRKADLALYKAKSLGRNQSFFYSSELENESIILSSLRDSLTNMDQEHFYLVFQPQIDSVKDELVGFEALSRWKHPEVDNVGPDVFIKLIENNGLMETFSFWLFEEAIKITTSWHKAKKLTAKQKIALNLSASQLHLPSLAGSIISLFSKRKAPAAWFTLEVTETAFIQDPLTAGLNLKQLKQAGFTIALDDFGTGYSSLSLLRQIPINTIKIDQSFVKDILDDQENASIVLAVIGLSKMLNIGIIAEGVEDKETTNWLRNNHCHIHQGYYFSKPLSEELALKLLNKHLSV